MSNSISKLKATKKDDLITIINNRDCELSNLIQDYDKVRNDLNVLSINLAEKNKALEQVNSALDKSLGDLTAANNTIENLKKLIDEAKTSYDVQVKLVKELNDRISNIKLISDANEHSAKINKIISIGLTIGIVVYALISVLF